MYRMNPYDLVPLRLATRMSFSGYWRLVYFRHAFIRWSILHLIFLLSKIRARLWKIYIHWRTRSLSSRLEMIENRFHLYESNEKGKLSIYDDGSRNLVCRQIETKIILLNHRWLNIKQTLYQFSHHDGIILYVGDMDMSEGCQMTITECGEVNPCVLSNRHLALSGPTFALKFCRCL